MKLKDSGARTTYCTGALKEPSTGRGRYDLLPTEALRRDALHYERGAEKYSPRNWERGIAFSACFCSLLRHAFQWLAGDRSEDHLAAVRWHAAAIMTYEAGIACGKLPAELNDLGGEVQDG
jgi:hypothetical protein